MIKLEACPDWSPLDNLRIGSQEVSYNIVDTWQSTILIHFVFVLKFQAIFNIIWAL